MKYIILDTNIYLHYTDIEQIDWKVIATNNDDFIICLPETVVEEIDNHKDKGRGKVQRKAKAISARFYKIFITQIHQESFAYKHLELPCDDLFKQYNLDNTKPDDKIIATALGLGIELSDIIIVSGDTNILLKAKNKLLGFYKLDDKYKLADEQSEDEKKIAALQKELDGYKNRLPNPFILFDSGEQQLKLKKPKVIRNVDSELSKVMLGIRNKYKYSIKIPQDEPYNNTSLLCLSNNIVTDDKREGYNMALNEYYEKMSNYHKFLIEKDVLSERFKEINFQLCNSGSAQTGDMNIFITFPAHIKLYNRESKRCINEEVPEPPNLLLGGFPPSFKMPQIMLNGSICTPSISAWDIDTVIDNKVVYSFSKLNHSVTVPVNIENSLFVDTETCGNFSIEWNICDSALLKSIKGTLNVIIE